MALPYSEQRQETLFQSLLGFLMRCNVPDLASGGVEPVVSIPIGFSNAL